MRWRSTRPRGCCSSSPGCPAPSGASCATTTTQHAEPGDGEMDPSAMLAVAAGPPLDPRTFSGLSANLFHEFGRRDVNVHPVATKNLRWHDPLRGAVSPAGLVRHASRTSARLRPDWFWSRRTNELMSARYRLAVQRCPAGWPALQVGTHV